MLKKSASFVLASFRSSTYPRGYASSLHSLRPCPRNGASRRVGVGRVRCLAFLSILRWFIRSLLAVRDPFLTVRLVQMIEDVVGFRQHEVSILEDRNIVLA